MKRLEYERAIESAWTSLGEKIRQRGYFYETELRGRGMQQSGVSRAAQLFAARLGYTEYCCRIPCSSTCFSFFAQSDAAELALHSLIIGQVVAE